MVKQKTKLEKLTNMFKTKKKFTAKGISSRLNSSENSVRKMICVLKDKGMKITLVSKGTYQSK